MTITTTTYSGKTQVIRVKAVEIDLESMLGPNDPTVCNLFSPLPNGGLEHRLCGTHFEVEP